MTGSQNWNLQADLQQGVELPKNWSNVNAQAYSKSFEPVTLFFSQNALRLVNLEHGCKILDVGCGPGGFAIHAKNLGFDVLATDFSEPMLEVLKLRDSSVKTEHLDGHTLEGIPNDYFDCVTSFFGVYTFQDRMAGWRSAHRVLKDGGTLIASSFDMESSQKPDFFTLLNIVPKFFPEDKQPLPYKNGADFKKTVIPCQLSNKDLFKKELEDAGFREIKFYNLIQSLILENKDQLFNGYLRTAANVREVFQTLSEDQQQRIRDDYYDAVGLDRGEGPQVIPTVAHVVVAKK